MMSLQRKSSTKTQQLNSKPNQQQNSNSKIKSGRSSGQLINKNIMNLGGQMMLDQNMREVYIPGTLDRLTPSLIHTHSVIQSETESKNILKNFATSVKNKKKSQDMTTSLGGYSAINSGKKRKGENNSSSNNRQDRNNSKVTIISLFASQQLPKNFLQQQQQQQIPLECKSTALQQTHDYTNQEEGGDLRQKALILNSPVSSNQSRKGGSQSIMFSPPVNKIATSNPFDKLKTVRNNNGGQTKYHSKYLTSNLMSPSAKSGKNKKSKKNSNIQESSSSIKLRNKSKENNRVPAEIQLTLSSQNQSINVKEYNNENSKVNSSVASKFSQQTATLRPDSPRCYINVEDQLQQHKQNFSGSSSLIDQAQVSMRSKGGAQSERDLNRVQSEDQFLSQFSRNNFYESQKLINTKLNSKSQMHFIQNQEDCQQQLNSQDSLSTFSQKSIHVLEPSSKIQNKQENGMMLNQEIQVQFPYNKCFYCYEREQQNMFASTQNSNMSYPNSPIRSIQDGNRIPYNNSIANDFMIINSIGSELKCESQVAQINIQTQQTSFMNPQHNLRKSVEMLARANFAKSIETLDNMILNESKIDENEVQSVLLNLQLYPQQVMYDNEKNIALIKYEELLRKIVAQYTKLQRQHYDLQNKSAILDQSFNGQNQNLQQQMHNLLQDNKNLQQIMQNELNQRAMERQAFEKIKQNLLQELKKLQDSDITLRQKLQTQIEDKQSLDKSFKAFKEQLLIAETENSSLFNENKRLKNYTEQQEQELTRIKQTNQILDKKSQENKYLFDQAQSNNQKLEQHFQSVISENQQSKKNIETLQSNLQQLMEVNARYKEDISKLMIDKQQISLKLLQQTQGGTSNQNNNYGHSFAQEQEYGAGFPQSTIPKAEIDLMAKTPTKLKGNFSNSQNNSYLFGMNGNNLSKQNSIDFQSIEQKHIQGSINNRVSNMTHNNSGGYYTPNSSHMNNHLNNTTFQTCLAGGNSSSVERITSKSIERKYIANDSSSVNQIMSWNNDTQKSHLRTPKAASGFRNELSLTKPNRISTDHFLLQSSEYEYLPAAGKDSKQLHSKEHKHFNSATGSQPNEMNPAYMMNLKPYLDMDIREINPDLL